MPSRSFLFLTLLCAAVTVPYFLSQDGFRGPAKKNVTDGTLRAEETLAVREVGEADSESTDEAPTPFWRKWFGSPDPPDSPSAQRPDTTTRSVSRPTSALPGRPVEARGLGGPPGLSIADVLRFDIQPEWVTQNWARVTTRLADLDYQGLRVPLVTGTEPHDVTGALSYYFDDQHVMRRIRLTGYTSDPEPLAALVQHRFNLRQYSSVSAGLYLSFRGNTPVGYLRFEQPLVQDRDRGTRYRLELEINAPGQHASLSEMTLQRLRQMQKANVL